jgi:NAD(P)-dependent dehydrogenase (short-subunit alcohol dehydrogenase family)
VTAADGLDGTTAIVTGASRGIGLAVTRALAGAGARVVAGARKSSPELEALDVQFVSVDLTDPSAADELVAAAGGSVGVLVNNVGTAPARPGGFASVSDADWLRTMELNLMCAVRMTRAVLPGMISAGTGSIVTVASVNARLPDPLVIDYSASKAAVLSFSKALSKEVGPHGIRMNTVSPGPVATDQWLGGGGVAATVSAAGGPAAADVAAAAAAQAVTGRFSTPAEVAALVLFLAGSGAANITGSDMIIDGGLITTT